MLSQFAVNGVQAYLLAAKNSNHSLVALHLILKFLSTDWPRHLEPSKMNDISLPTRRPPENELHCTFLPPPKAELKMEQAISLIRPISAAPPSDSLPCPSSSVPPSLPHFPQTRRMTATLLQSLQSRRPHCTWIRG